MSSTPRRLFLAALCLAVSTPALAEDTCNVKAVLSGKPVTMKHCAAAIYEVRDGYYSLTLYFSDAPFAAKELETFQMNSYATDKTADGKPRTMMHFAFCPGAKNAAETKSVETSVNLASDFMASRQCVFELPKDKDMLKIERLTGTIAPNGKLSGRITGGKLSDGLKYSWEADFDLTLPAKPAFGGPGCGS